MLPIFYRGSSYSIYFKRKITQEKVLKLCFLTQNNIIGEIGTDITFLIRYNNVGKVHHLMFLYLLKFSKMVARLK